MNEMNAEEIYRFCSFCSFDDRVCDDLTEVLLSHLSFEDKIRFECISKQFKQLVFNKQKVLSDGKGDKNDVLPHLWSKPKTRTNALQSQSVKPNLIQFESLLKKCKSINTFRFDVINNEMMKLLTKHCNELKTIKSDFSQINIEVMNSFGQKFGQSLQRIGLGFNGGGLKKSMIKLFPKLIAIQEIQFNQFIDSNDFIHFEKLTELRIKITNESDMDLFDIFVDKYKTQLKSLTIHYLLDNQIDEIFGNQLIKFFRSIAKEFTQLTEFHFNFYNRYEINGHKLHKILVNITQMVNIQKLVLRSGPTIPAILTTFHPMKDLTSLTLNYFKLADESFTYINKRFPNLRELTIHDPNTFSITAQTLRSLSKLKNLKRVLIFSKLDLKDEDMIQFITECKNIQHLTITSTRSITITTIETIISLALSKPQNKFRFDLNFRENLPQFEKKVPKNLRIYRFGMPLH